MRGHAFEQGEPLEGEMGEWGVRGVQYTANLGQEWTGIHATTQRRDFQVSKKEFPDGQGWDFQVVKGVARKGLRACTLCIYYANKRLCLGYK